MKIVYLILMIVSLSFSIEAFSQCEYYKFSDPPIELVRGRINEYGMRRTHPYTLFVVDNDFNLDATLQQIRNNLYSIVPIDVRGDFVFPPHSYADLYKNIWQKANEAEPGKCPEDNGCKHPKWVKRNALVYLIGLRYKKSEITNQDTLVEMDFQEKEGFALILT